MDWVVSHFLLYREDGTCTVYEVEYAVSPHREGILSYAKVPGSERPCTCPVREAHARRLAGAPN